MVDRVDFRVGAERTPDELELGLEQRFRCKSILKFAKCLETRSLEQDYLPHDLRMKTSIAGADGQRSQAFQC